MREGPVVIRNMACMGCMYLEYTLGVNQVHTWCKHPKLKNKKDNHVSIGSFDRGEDRGIPMPKWCPAIKH